MGTLGSFLASIALNEYDRMRDRDEAQAAMNAKMLDMIKNIGIFANPDVFSHPAMSDALKKHYGEDKYKQYKTWAQGDPKKGTPSLMDLLSAAQVGGNLLEGRPPQEMDFPVLGETEAMTEPSQDVALDFLEEGAPELTPEERVLATQRQAQPLAQRAAPQQRGTLQLHSITPSGPSFTIEYPEPQTASVFINHLRNYVRQNPDNPADGLLYAAEMTGEIPTNIGSIIEAHPAFSEEAREFFALQTYLEEAGKSEEPVDLAEILRGRGFLLSPEQIENIQETALQLHTSELALDPDIRELLATQASRQGIKRKADVERYIQEHAERMARRSLGIPEEVEPVKISKEAERYLSQLGIEKPYTSREARMAEQAVIQERQERELEFGVRKVAGETRAREEVQRQKEMESFEFFVGELLHLSPQVNVAPGGWERFLQGIATGIEGWLQTDPVAADFMSFRKSFLARFARSFGEKGVLTEGDIRRAERMLPTIFDSREVAKRKVERLMRYLQYLYRKDRVSGALSEEEAEQVVEKYYTRFSPEAVAESLSEADVELTPEQRDQIIERTTVSENLTESLRNKLQNMMGGE